MKEPILFSPEKTEKTEKLNIKFIYRKNLHVTLDFDKKITVREMLNAFLDHTNSIKTLDQKKIMFFHGTNLLNLPRFIDKNIENVFGRGIITIQVKDKGNFIGG